MLLNSLLILALHCACGSSMRIPDSIYITALPPVDTEEQESRDVKTDLVAPHLSSLSQYEQHQNFPHPLIFQQRPQMNPFIYTGPLILLEATSALLQQKNIERSLADHEENSYKLYRPDPADNPQFVDMLPPPENQDEPNYFVIKPRKMKKYANEEGKAKKPSKKEIESLKKQIVNVEDEETSDSTEVDVSSRLPNDSASDSTRQQEPDESVEMSEPASRLDFQMHGHKGPASYKFGYDTGKGNNRQLRHEEKDQDGNVFGLYGYYDDKGKFRVVKYSSMADGGFNVL